MNIVIAGAGKVGEVLCSDLTSENHNIMLIELNEARLDQLINLYDISGIHGNCAMFDIQTEASVDTCDVFIAVTKNDETNLIAAITARKLGAKFTVARVRDPGYSKQMTFLRESLGITLIINPELEAAQEIARTLIFPSALQVESFEHGRVNMIEVVLQKNTAPVGIKLKDHKGRFGNVVICIVIRNDQVTIPDGETILLAEDHVMVTGSPREVRTFSKLCQSDLIKINSAVIIGGGRLTDYLLSRLIKMRMKLKVIEIDTANADRLAIKYPQAEIIFGDGTKQAFLDEEHFTDYDAVIPLTGVDEENILIAIYAYRMGVKKTITKINRTDLLKVLDNVGLQSIITPKRLIANHIIRFIRSTENSQGSNISAFYRLLDGRVEVLQFKVKGTCREVDIPLMDLKTKPGLLIACIVRNGKIIYPNGTHRILPNDDVIVVTTKHKNFQDIDDIFDQNRGL
ncbi:MAG: Trk system potassium transporter TrkA [Acetobacterium sp.]